MPKARRAGRFSPNDPKTFYLTEERESDTGVQKSSDGGVTWAAVPEFVFGRVSSIAVAEDGTVFVASR